ncbi:MAG: phosphotransferase family protein [Nocardioidaceae bacterium]
MSVDLWTSAGFVEEARAWVAQSLAPRGIALTGEWEQPHARSWSSAIRFETTDGRVWFMVNGVGTRHEPALVRLLGATVPGLAPEVLATDDGRGWSLSRDGGPILRTLAGPDRLWRPWETVVAWYAEAQIALAGHRDAVLGTGLREVSPTTTPALARRLRDELGGLPPEKGGLTAEQEAAVNRRLPELDAWCAELAACGVPDSVQHDDLHSANVCWTPAAGGAATMHVIDWGDASWGSPLGTMLGTMNSLAFHAGVFREGGPVDDPRVLRVRDAYLEPFTVYADRAVLVRCVELARRTGCIAKALSYEAALRAEPLSTHEEMEFPVREWFLGITEEFATG